MLVTLAWREIRHHLRFVFLFIASLALGFCGFLTLRSLKVAIANQLEEQARVLLGGDLSISSKVPLSDRAWKVLTDSLGPIATYSDQVSFSAMVAHRGLARLAEVKAIDVRFPLIGSLTTENGEKISERDIKELNRHLWAWVEPELATQLRLRTGDSIKIGAYAFEVQGIIANKAPNTWRNSALQPKVYLGISDVASLGLLPEGNSGITYERLLLLPNGTPSDKSLKSLIPLVEGTFHSPKKIIQENVQWMAILNDFLGLTSLISLFLSTLGATYLLRSFVSAHYRTIAILIYLGLTPERARLLYLFQSMTLGVFSVIPAALLSLLLLIPLTHITNFLIGFELPLAIPLTALFQTLALALVTSWCVALPALQSIRECHPTILLHEDIGTNTQRYRLVWWTLFPLFSVLWMLAIGEAHSLSIGTGFTLAIALSSCLLMGSATIFIWILGLMVERCGLVCRLAWRNIIRCRLASLSCFLAIGLGSLLINLTEHLRDSLYKHANTIFQHQETPLLLLEIQEDEIEGVKKFSSEMGLKITAITPSISAQLVRHNGTAPQKKLKPLNITYEEKGAGEISIARPLAKKLGLEMGDLVEFDIQGVPIEGIISSFMESEPYPHFSNFSAVLDSKLVQEAPKTFTAAITVDTTMRKEEIQRQLIDQYPDISIYDTMQRGQRLQQMAKHMIWAMQLMACTVFATALFVVYAIARHHMASRTEEISLMKTLGTPRLLLLSAITWEFATLALFSILTSSAICYLIGWGSARFFFETNYSFSAFSTLWVGLISIVLTTITGLIASRKALLYSSPLFVKKNGRGQRR